MVSSAHQAEKEIVFTSPVVCLAHFRNKPSIALTKSPVGTFCPPGDVQELQCEIATIAIIAVFSTDDTVSPKRTPRLRSQLPTCSCFSHIHCRN